MAEAKAKSFLDGIDKLIESRIDEMRPREFRKFRSQRKKIMKGFTDHPGASSSRKKE